VVGTLTQDLLELCTEEWLGVVDGARALGCDLLFSMNLHTRALQLALQQEDGVGFDPDLRYPGHLGPAGMRQRIPGLGGRFDVDTSTAGTTIPAVLPGILRPAADAPTARGTAGSRGGRA
jgi:glucose-6-phosphate-specific signal transduction histidine kinase